MAARQKKTRGSEPEPGTDGQLEPTPKSGEPLSPASLDVVTRTPVSSPADLFDLWEELSGFSVPNTLRDNGAWDITSSRVAFRGQPRDFGTLTPSFQRVFGERQSTGAASIIEESLIDDFRVHYGELNIDQGMPQLLQLEQDRYLALSVMQHYGVPTRLLDWTSSFWTAVYFACSGDADADGELWYYDRGLFVHNESLRLLEFDPDITPRMESQAAHFTYSEQILDDHAPLLHELAVRPDGRVLHGFRRVVVQRGAKERTLRFLDEQLGVTASTVFPDVEGLGRFLRWQLGTLLTRLL